MAALFSINIACLVALNLSSNVVSLNIASDLKPQTQHVSKTKGSAQLTLWTKEKSDPYPWPWPSWVQKGSMDKVYRFSPKSTHEVHQASLKETVTGPDTIMVPEIITRPLSSSSYPWPWPSWVQQSQISQAYKFPVGIKKINKGNTYNSHPATTGVKHIGRGNNRVTTCDDVDPKKDVCLKGTFKYMLPDSDDVCRRCNCECEMLNAHQWNCSVASGGMDECVAYKVSPSGRRQSGVNNCAIGTYRYSVVGESCYKCECFYNNAHEAFRQSCAVAEGGMQECKDNGVDPPHTNDTGGINTCSKGETRFMVRNNDCCRCNCSWSQKNMAFMYFCLWTSPDDCV